MTQASDFSAPPRDDARALQARLYREIGIAAVAAALRFTTQPEPASRSAKGMDKPADGVQETRARAA